jgi:HEAT repeat protein
MLEGLAWIRDNSEAYCVTFVQRLDETELLRRFGGDLAWARLARYDNWEAVEELQMLGDVVRVGYCDGWAFVYEDNGYRGTLSEVLQPLSAGTVAVSVFRNINFLRCFGYAENTIVDTFSDPIMPFDDASPQVQALLHQAGITRETIEEAFDDFEDGMFALAKAAGVRLDRASIAEKPLLISVIKNPVSEFVADLLDRGADEQTADRLLAILRDRTGGYGYQEYPHQGCGWNLLALLHHALPDKRRPFHPDRPHLKRLHARAEDCLRALLSAQVMPALLKALDEEDQYLRAVVIEMLNLLVRFDLAQDDEATQERLLALASALEPLLKALKELRKDPPMPASPHSEHLRQKLAAENRKLQLSTSEIVKALIEFDRKHGGEDARKRLLALASAPDAEVASSAAIALGTLEDQRAVGPLLDVLDRFAREEEPAANFPYSFEREAVQLLGHMHPDNVIEHLLSLLRPQGEDTDPQQSPGRYHEARRQSAFQRDLLAVLGQIGGAQAIERLLTLLNPQARTQYECSFQQGLLAALTQTGDAQAVEPLLKLLNPRPEGRYAYDFQLRLLEALGNLGEKRVIEPLARLLNPDAHHPYEWHFQEYLIKALRQLGDSRADLQVVEQAFQQWSKTTQRVSRVSLVHPPRGAKEL